MVDDNDDADATDEDSADAEDTGERRLKLVMGPSTRKRLLENAFT